MRSSSRLLNKSLVNSIYGLYVEEKNVVATTDDAHEILAEVNQMFVAEAEERSGRASYLKRIRLPMRTTSMKRTFFDELTQQHHIAQVL